LVLPTPTSGPSNAPRELFPGVQIVQNFRPGLSFLRGHCEQCRDISSEKYSDAPCIGRHARTLTLILQNGEKEIDFDSHGRGLTFSSQNEAKLRILLNVLAIDFTVRDKLDEKVSLEDLGAELRRLEGLPSEPEVFFKGTRSQQKIGYRHYARVGGSLKAPPKGCPLMVYKGKANQRKCGKDTFKEGVCYRHWRIKNPCYPCRRKAKA